MQSDFFSDDFLCFLIKRFVQVNKIAYLCTQRLGDGCWRLGDGCWVIGVGDGGHKNNVASPL